MSKRINVNKNLLEKEIWVSCSAGVDSIAGAHFLSQILKYDIKLIHYNHNLRPQNDLMELKISEFANQFNLDLVIERRKEDSCRSEDLLRKDRIEGLRRHINGKVIFCQHLDDCVEGYLMNCLRGTPEYCPMPPYTKFGKMHVVRPFLLTPKSVFIDYCNRNKLYDFIVEDETNTDISYRRNWTRHRLIPVVHEHYSGISKVVKKKMIQFYEKGDVE